MASHLYVVDIRPPRKLMKHYYSALCFEPFP